MCVCVRECVCVHPRMQEAITTRNQREREINPAQKIHQEQELTGKGYERAEEEGGTVGGAARCYSPPLAALSLCPPPPPLYGHFAHGQSHRQSHPSRAGIQLLNKAESMSSQVLNGGGGGGRFIGRQPRVRRELHRHQTVKRPHYGSKKKKKKNECKCLKFCRLEVNSALWKL